MLGVIIGKFYPPHLGHSFLIQCAIDRASDVVVIVCDHPQQVIRGAVRAAWLQEQFPGVRIVITPDDLPDEPEPWADRTISLLGRAPDIVFSSEDYGPGFASALKCQHFMVDRERCNVPISATKIRENPLGHLEHVHACVRRDIILRVVIIGVESTGKSTLAAALAKALRTEWVPEYGREYSAQKTGTWETKDFVAIAKEQQRRESDAASSANQVLICDTNAVATSVWHRRYMGEYSDEVEGVATKDRVDLYLLTLPDFPFVQDGTRDGEHIRHEMHEWFVRRLALQRTKVVEIGGGQLARLEKSLKEIQVAVETKNRDMFN
ncbi:MAG: AAA family ATPase [Armatimonadota bacterium]